MTTIHRLQYSPPLAAKVHIVPQGNLLDKPACHGLWYFLRCAHTAAEKIPAQATLTTDQDSRCDLLAMARSIAQAYGVELNELFADENWRRVKAEADESLLPIDTKIAAFIDSGGQAYRFYDRDQDALLKDGPYDANT